MRLAKYLAPLVGLAGMWAATSFALAGDPAYVFVKSAPPTVLQISLADVKYGFEGQATIPFTLTNSRAHVWLVVYTKDQSTPGGFGGPSSPIAPDGALWRKAGLPNMVTVVDKGQFEVGSHTVTWDGKDANGNAVASGDYTLYLVGLNDLDDVNVVGPSGSSGNGYGRVSIDANWPTQGQYTISIQTGKGIVRYQIGTQNWLQDPTPKAAYPVYDTFPNLAISYGTDSQDYNTGYLASVYGGGVAKFHFLTAPNIQADTQFGPEGTGLRAASDITTNAPKFQSIVERGGKLYVTHGDWGQDPPQSEIIVLDKNDGSTVGRIDLGQWFNVTGVDATGTLVSGSDGPAVEYLDRDGILLGNGGWGTGADAQGPDGGANFGLFMKVGYDGQPIWINDNGDGFGDSISPATAAALGITPQQQGVQTIWGVPVESSSPAAGFSVIAEVGPESDSFGALIGPDGAGIMHVRTTKAGTQSPWQTGNFIIQDGSAYDGFYFVTGSGSDTNVQPIKDACGSAAVMGHMPMAIAKAVIGPNVSTAVEEVDAARPGKYALGSAYPNPFNPSTSIEFDVPEAAYVHLDVFNSTGQLVRRLVDQSVAAGRYKTQWDATDARGVRVASGTYIYRMQTDRFQQSRSFTLLR